MLNLMTIARRIAESRTTMGWTQSALASAVGVSRTAVSFWEDGKSAPRRDKIPIIAKALGVDPDWLEHGETRREGIVMMPIKGEIAAGLWREAIERGDETIPVAPHGDYPTAAQYALQVRGNSINKIAADSEYLIAVDVEMAGIQPRSGDLVVVNRHRHGMTEATVKRLVRHNGTYRLKPESTDPAHQDILTLESTDPSEEIVISAVVIGKFSTIARGGG